ncbi:MAG: aldose 1-epimerase family protein [Actinobacteria bacterium]|nr:aldose 1-epimerase family protein [Actinomycetota bacterium]
MEIFGKKYSKKELMEKTGDISQLGGIKFMEYTDGPGRGVRVAEIKNAAGLYALVLLDRSLDISYFDYKGASLVWRSTVGDTSPFMYESQGTEWLRTFFGGLLCTCGASYMGASCVDDGEELGLHGRISNSLGYDISTGSSWEGDQYYFWVEGKAKEAGVFLDSLELKRRITMSMDGLWIKINDTVTNIGNRRSPVMMLYHINFGFPLLDEGAKLIEFNGKVVPRDEEAKKYFDSYNVIEAPQPDYKERVYLHDIPADRQGYSHIILSNEKFDRSNGMGMHMKFKKDNLPYLTQWKNPGVREYVLGLEPGNSYPRGRAVEKAEGTVRYLEMGEEVDFEIIVEVLSSNDKIEARSTEVLANY